METEQILCDPALKEEFRRLKKRDLTESYLFQVACGFPGPHKCCGSAFRKHIMDLRNVSLADRPQPKHRDARPPIPATVGRGAAELHSSFAEGHPATLPDWISGRKTFRKAIDGMGDLRRWFHNKPTLSDLEVVVMERHRQAKQMSRVKQTSMFPPSPPDVAAVRKFIEKGFENSPSALRCEVEEVRNFLGMCESSSLSKLLDRNGTGKLKRVDLHHIFKKEGIFIQPERLNELILLLKSKDGTSVTVDDLAAGVQAWSQKHQELEEQTSNSCYWNIDHDKGIEPNSENKDDQVVMQDMEILAIMRPVLAASKISCPSSLSGPMGREVNNFRNQCNIEFLKSVELCKQRGLNVSQATLQKALLHPGDMSMSELGGKGLTAKTHQGAHMQHKELKKQLFRWADPDAFWPGRQDHVRLFLPVMTNSPAMVLFQRVEHSVSTSPGHWPVNHLGYSTSGDIEARKLYTL